MIFLISATYVSDIKGKIEMPLLIIDLLIIIIFIIGYSKWCANITWDNLTVIFQYFVNVATVIHELKNK